MNGIEFAAILLRGIRLGLPKTMILAIKVYAPEAFNQTEPEYPLAKTHFAL